MLYIPGESRTDNRHYAKSPQCYAVRSRVVVSASIGGRVVINWACRPANGRGQHGNRDATVRPSIVSGRHGDVLVQGPVKERVAVRDPAPARIRYYRGENRRHSPAGQRH